MASVSPFCRHFCLYSLLMTTLVSKVFKSKRKSPQNIVLDSRKRYVFTSPWLTESLKNSSVSLIKVDLKSGSLCRPATIVLYKTYTANVASDRNQICSSNHWLTRERPMGSLVVCRSLQISIANISLFTQTYHIWLY